MDDFDKVDIRNRERAEQTEAQVLAPFAQLSSDAHSTRLLEEPEHIFRTAFQRDRDRIIHSRAFRRLKHKRQVFLPAESDHYRTRITHTLEVSQLAQTIARALALNEDLVEAIALGHDLGHTPFGHLGEVVLNEVMTGVRLFKGQKTGHDFGGFKHNYQSVRIVDNLESKYPFNGLNLTAVVREGMLKHTRLRRQTLEFPDFHYEGLYYESDTASSLEGQVVAIADEIAQRTHDLEDGIRAGLVDLKQIRQVELIRRIEGGLQLRETSGIDEVIYCGLIIRGLIDFLVDDVIQTGWQNLQEYFAGKNVTRHVDDLLIKFSPATDPFQNELNKFIYKNIIHLSRVKWSDELGKELIFRLFESYYHNPDLLPADLSIGSRNKGEQENGIFFRSVCDYIAGMTDSFAIREAERLADSGKIKIDDLDIKSALGNPL